MTASASRAGAKKIAAGALLAFFCLKTLELFKHIPAGETIFDLKYQFGPMVEALLRHGVYGDLSTLPPRYAARMPLLPCLLALLGKLSLSSRTVAFAKSAALSALCACALLPVMDIHHRLFPKAGGAWLVLVPLALSPNLALHASMITYEEGLLVEMLFVWALLFLLGLLLWSRREGKGGAGLAASCLALGTLAFLCKDSMLLVWLASLGLGALWALRFRAAKIRLCLLVSLAAVLAWGAHTLECTGRFSIFSSWDGENSYRAFNRASYEIYPDLCLDQIFMRPHIVPLSDGRSAVIGQSWQYAFKNEWAWNDYYRGLALQWVESDPARAAKFELKKIHNFFFSLEPHNYFTGFDAEDAFWARVCLRIGRLMQLEMLVLAALLWRRGGWGVLLAGVTTVNLAYAAPYIVGFNYERHISVYLVLVAVCLFMLVSALLSAADPAPRPT